MLIFLITWYVIGLLSGAKMVYDDGIISLRIFCLWLITGFFGPIALFALISINFENSHIFYNIWHRIWFQRKTDHPKKYDNEENEDTDD